MFTTKHEPKTDLNIYKNDNIQNRLMELLNKDCLVSYTHAVCNNHHHYRRHHLHLASKHPQLSLMERQTGHFLQCE